MSTVENMNPRGTKVGPRDRVAAELRRLAKVLLLESDKRRKAALLMRGEESTAWANFALGLIAAHDRLMTRAARLERAARKGAK